MTTFEGSMVFALMSALGRPDNSLTGGETAGLLNTNEPSLTRDLSSGYNKHRLDAGPQNAAAFANDTSVEMSDQCRCVVRIVSVLTCAAGVLVSGVNVYLMIQFEAVLRMYVVRCYNVLFGLLIVLAEIDRPDFILDYVRFLKYWPSKGAFVCFVGVLTLDIEEREDSHLQSIAALFAIAIGVLYFILGLFCLRICRCFSSRHPDDESDDRADTFDASDPVLDRNSPSWLDPAKDTSI